MSSTVTNSPLHEVILEIMFLENMEKAVPMKSEDVLWRIDNPEISERQVREVLDWLVRQKKVELYLGHYSIDRIEFLEQKENYELSLLNENKTKTPSLINSPMKSPKKRKTFYVNPPKKKYYKYQILILIFGVFALGYLTYAFLDLKYVFHPSDLLNKQSESIINTIPNQKRLYVSEDELYTMSAKKAIYYSFVRQNRINSLNVKEFNRLQLTLDSITRTHENELRILQTEIQKSSDRSNIFLKKLISCNIAVIALILFLYFKKR